MSSSADTVVIRGGTSRLVVGDPDTNGIRATTSGASIQVTGNGDVTAVGGSPVSSEQLADAFQNVTSLRVIDDAGNKVGSVTVANGKAEMELNGEAVPTMSFEESRAFLQGLTTGDYLALGKSEEFRAVLLGCVVGDTAVIDLQNFTFPVNAPFGYTSDLPLLGFDRYVVHLGQGVAGLKRLVLSAKRAPYAGGCNMALRNADVDFHLIFSMAGWVGFTDLSYLPHFANSLQITFLGTTNIGSLGVFGSSNAIYPRFSDVPFPVKFIFPCATSMDLTTGAFFTKSRQGNDIQATKFDVTAALPRYVTSFSFYKLNYNSVKNLAYLMDNLGTPATGSLPQLTFGIDAALVDASGDEPVYSDASLQAAVERFRAKGWEDVPNPLTETPN